MLVWVLMRPARDQRAPAGNGNSQASNRNDHNGPVKLFMYCAAGMTKPVEAATKNFEREVDISLELSFGGSGTLLNNLQVAKHGDIYLAADTTYIEIAREKGLLDEVIPLAKFRPVIAVRKGNPKNIKSVADLLRDDVIFAIANDESSRENR